MSTVKAPEYPLTHASRVLKRTSSSRTPAQKRALKFEIWRVHDVAELEELETLIKAQILRAKDRQRPTPENSFSFDSDSEGFGSSFVSNASSRVTLVNETSYTYSRMYSDEMQFRILHLLPSSSEDSIIECQLQQCSLNEFTPSYEALSYTWGSSKKREQILLDQYPFDVTPNLYHALQNFRHATEPRLLWVDAVCIDQHSIEERNHQVQNMRAIYQQAQQVLVWLGPAANSSLLAFDFLNICASEVKEYRRIVHSTLKMYPSHLYALQCLLQRDYWDRLWVIQEVASAQRASVHCGKQSMEWNTFVQLQSFLCQKYCVSILEGVAAEYSNLGMLIDTLQHHGPRALILEGASPTVLPSLAEILLKHQHKKCSEPSDKVYGLIGLTSAKDDKRLCNIDYVKSIRKVYTDAAKHIITKSSKLDIICAKPRSSKNPHGLPSWVPDWDSESSAIALPMKFCASQLSEASEVVGPVGYGLNVRGYLIDTVGPSRPSYNMKSSNDIQGAMKTFCAWHNLVRRSAIDDKLGGEYPASLEESSRATAFARVISCNGPPLVNQHERDKFVISALAMKATRVCTDLLEDELPWLPHHPIAAIDSPKALSLISWIAKLMLGRSFFVSEEQHLLGMGPDTIQEDDMICVLHGCQLPVVLRPVRHHHVFIGACYVDGLMWGEAMEEEGRELKSWKIC